jgi:hypothetical protein
VRRPTTWRAKEARRAQLTQDAVIPGCQTIDRGDRLVLRDGDVGARGVPMLATRWLWDHEGAAAENRTVVSRLVGNSVGYGGGRGVVEGRMRRRGPRVAANMEAEAVLSRGNDVAGCSWWKIVSRIGSTLRAGRGPRLGLRSGRHRISKYNTPSPGSSSQVLRLTGP